MFKTIHDASVNKFQLRFNQYVKNALIMGRDIKLKIL